MKQSPFTTVWSRTFVLVFIFIFYPSSSSAFRYEFPQVEHRIIALSDSGDSCLDKGDLTDARRYFEEALQLNEDFQPALIGLGRVFLNMDANANQALRYLRKATELVPTDPAAHYYKALTHLKLEKSVPNIGHVRSALEELDMVLALDPSHPDANYRKGLVLYDKRREFEEAEAALRLQVSANPTHVEARQLLLNIEMDRGREKLPLIQALFGTLLGRHERQDSVSMIFAYSGIDGRVSYEFRTVFPQTDTTGRYLITLEIHDQVAGTSTVQTKLIGQPK